jgi:hypothetical protein
MTLSRDAMILVGLIAVLVVGTLAFSSRSTSVGPPYQLSGHGSVLGLSGLGAGLSAAGYSVDRGVRPTLQTGGLTVLVQPQTFSRDEAAQWREAIRGGATVLLAANRPNALTAELGLRYGAGGQTWESPAGYEAFPSARIPDNALHGFSRVPPGSKTLVRTVQGGPAMVVVPIGRGSVWATTSPRWLTNANVQQTGLGIAMPLAEMTGGEVTVDEFHHGAGPRGGTFGYLPADLQLALLEAAIVAVAAVLTVARRLGPALAQGDEHQPSTAELARSMGAMYRSGSRLEPVTGALSAQLRRRVGGLGGVDKPLAALDSATDERGAVAAWQAADEATRRVTGAGA